MTPIPPAPDYLERPTATPDPLWPEIKPCPYCGAEGYLDEIDGYRPSSPKTYRLMCIANNCNVEGLECDSKAEAIDWWNHRPVEDALAARVAQLEQELMVGKIRGMIPIEVTA